MALPRFKVGDLVKACYTYYEYYTFPYYEDDDLFYPWNGLVASIYYDYEYFEDEPIYEIVCTDGTLRYFSEWELELINKS